MELPQYRSGARWYDVISLERPLYRAGRLAAVAMVDPSAGERVLDIGCGTGLSFAPLVHAVGPSGRVVGLDASPSMLGRASRRVRRYGWTQVDLVCAEAGAGLPVGGARFDVILFCYSLSVLRGWQGVWGQAMELLAPGGRVAVVDTAYLDGPRRVLNPVVGLLLCAGGVHPERRVWELPVRDLDRPQQRDLLAGHIRVAAGQRAA